MGCRWYMYCLNLCGTLGVVGFRRRGGEEGEECDFTEGEEDYVEPSPFTNEWSGTVFDWAQISY